MATTSWRFYGNNPRTVLENLAVAPAARPVHYPSYSHTTFLGLEDKQVEREGLGGDDG
jgi:hypothetical protein